MALAEDHNYALAAEPAQIDNLGHSANRGAHTNILDPGFDLTLRPMRYPQFFEMYKDAIKNTWTVEEIDFSDDLTDLDRKLMPAEKHLISRLVAFFATGDSIVANNLVLNLYQHISVVVEGLPGTRGRAVFNDLHRPSSGTPSVGCSNEAGGAKPRPADQCRRYVLVSTKARWVTLAQKCS